MHSKVLGELLVAFATLVEILISVSLAAVKVETGAQGPHLEFEGVKAADYLVLRSKLDVELQVPKLADEDLQKILALKSPHFVAVKGRSSEKTSILFKLKNADIDFFDYLTDKPDRLIIDFYDKQGSGSSSVNGPTKVEEPTAREVKGSSKASTGDSAAASSAAPSRAPANSDQLVLVDSSSEKEPIKLSRLLDGADPTFERFKIREYEISDSALIKSKELLLLELPLLQAGSRFFEHLKLNQPVYEITPTSEDENKQARLLLVLYQKQRNALFLKTLTWYRQKYPDSKYIELLDFMSADVHMRMYYRTQVLEEFELAMHEYMAASERFPESPLSARTQMLVAFETFERGDLLGAIRLFQKRLEDKALPSLHRDAALLGLSQALLRLNKMNEATERLEEVIKNGKSESMRADALLQKAEILDAQKRYLASIQAFRDAIRQFPNQIKKFPRAYYNLGLVQFKAGLNREALDSFREFIVNNSDHPAAGYALNRIGEIFEILGAPKEKILGVYREAEYRYGGSVGSILPRMKLLSYKMATMKPREAESAIQEIREVAKKLPLNNVEFYVTSLVSDGLHGRKEFARAADTLISFYQANPTELRLPLLAEKIQRIVNDQLYDYSSKNDFISVFETYEKFENTWLKNSDRIDTHYFLAKASEQGFDLAKSYTGYQSVLNRVYALQGTEESKERAVLEKLPTPDQLHLRMAQVLKKMGKPTEAYTQIMKISKTEAFSPEEQIERVQIAVDLLKARGEPDTAQRYLSQLVKEWGAEPNRLAPVLLETAKLYRDTGENEKALVALDRIAKDNQTAPLQDGELVFAASRERVDLLLEIGNAAKATQYLPLFLVQYEESKPLSSYRYRLGELHFKSGELRKAKDVWAGLKGKGSEVWAQLADENIRHAEWVDANKKYLKRMPASGG